MKGGGLRERGGKGEISLIMRISRGWMVEGIWLKSGIKVLEDTML